MLKSSPAHCLTSSGRTCVFEPPERPSLRATGLGWVTQFLHMTQLLRLQLALLRADEHSEMVLQQAAHLALLHLLLVLLLHLWALHQFPFHLAQPSRQEFLPWQAPLSFLASLHPSLP